MTTTTEIIREKLEKILAPTALIIRDDSHLHKGHAGAADGRGHFAVSIASPAFHNKPRLQCHRIIYAALGELMHTHIHALKITIL